MQSIRIKIVKKDDIDIEKEIKILKENGFDIVNSNVSYVFTFGGDGTILKAVKYSLRYNAPIVAINYGKFGYMASNRAENIYALLDSIKKKEYVLSKRYLLECRIKDKNVYALNDVVFKSEYLDDIRLYDKNILVTTYRSCGLIISSPTGSTGYALSAGGSIIYPELRLLNVVAISSQYLATRSLVLGDTNLKIESNSSLYIDGKKYAKEKIVKVSLSEKYINILELNDNNYYDVLKNKFKWR